MPGGFPVVHLSEGAGFNGQLSEGEPGLRNRGIKNGDGGPGGRGENKVVGVCGGFVASLQKNESNGSVGWVVVASVGEVFVAGER